MTCLRCYDARCNDREAGPYVNFLVGFLKKQGKIKTQFNQLFWDVWPKISACLEDFAQIVGDETMEEYQDRGEAIDFFMKETIITTTKVDVPPDQDWETEKVPMIGDNIISLFDQLCYLVVFGNRSDMEAMITDSKERDDFFQGIRKSANKARDNFATSWKEQLRNEKTVSRRISRVHQSGRFDEDDEDGEGGEEEGVLQDKPERKI